MAPIDPLQLLKALSPLLSPEGGIRSPDEVSRLSSLMKKFSRKLVSRCVYCSVLASTSTDILEVFLDLDGWSTIHTWLQEAKASGNMPFLCELLNLCQQLPMSLERLKENAAPKLIKSLTKSGDENVRAASEKVVSAWMKIIKGHSKDASEPARKVDTTVKKKNKKSLSSSSSRKDVSVKLDRSNGSIDEATAAADTSVLDDTDATSNNTSALDDGAHDLSANSFSSTASSDWESPSNPTESPPKKAKRADRPRTVKTFRARFRSTGLEEASPPPPAKAGTKKVSRPAFDKRAIQDARQRLVPTMHGDPWAKPSSLMATGDDGHCAEGPGIRLIGLKPMHVLREDGGFMDALTAAPAPSNAGTPRRKRKPIGAAAAAKRNSPDGPTEPAPKLHFYKDTLEAEEAATATPAAEEDGAKARDVAEDDEDDDIAKRVKRRKRGCAKAPDGEGVASTEEGADSPPTPTQDEDAATTKRNEPRKAREGEATDEAAEITNDGQEEQLPDLAEPESGKSASILSMTRKKTRKSVSWAEESKLRMFHYFELDETERVNVSNPQNFGDMKTLEMRRERQAVETARRLMGDRMEEAIPFRTPRRLTLPQALVKRGTNSQEKETQRLRQQHTLQEIYFSKDTIPDSPHEADPEQLSSQEPKVIPLEDESASSVTLDYSHAEPSAASRLPPILSNLVRSIAPKGQRAQSSSAPLVATQQEAQGQFSSSMPQQTGLFQNLTGMQCSGAGQIPPGMQMMGMYPNSMQNQGAHMMGSSMSVGGTGGFPMAVTGPMHPHGVGADAGNWGIMRPGMPEDGAGFYGRCPGPGMGMGPMGMTADGGGQQGMDVQRNGTPLGRSAPTRSHRPRVPCKFFMNSHCRFGAGCTFLHPGVNGPPLQ